MSAVDLYSYLIELSTRNKDIKADEVNKLFTEFLNGDSLPHFLKQLTLNADGNLLVYLQKLDLKEAGIKTVSELIEHLIKNTDTGGFTVDDVFSLLSRTLGQSKLEDFIEGLKEFAPSALLKLLNQLDLKKSGRRSIEDLIKYLSEHTTEFGYSIEDVWNSILQMALSGENNNLNEQNTPTHQNLKGTGKVLAISLIIIGLTGILLFFIMFFKRKKGEYPSKQ